MKLTLKENEAEARERHRAFWLNKSLGRPALYVIAQNPNYWETAWSKPEIGMKQRDLLPEWHVHQMQHFLNSQLFLAEAMPIASLVVGTDITNTAVLLGGDYEYCHGEAIITENPATLDNIMPSFDREHYLVQSLEKCYYTLAAYVKDKAFVNTPMTLDALTTISMLLNPLNLCRELVLHPGKIKTWTGQITAMYLKFYDHFYEILQRMGYGESSAWMQVMAEGKFELLRCDFAVMISPAMFEEFALPDLRTISEHMEYSMYNLDSVCKVRFLDSLRKLNRLNGIYWNPEPKEADHRKWINTLRRIKEMNFCLQVDCRNLDEAVFVSKELGPDSLLITLPPFQSREDAEAAIEIIENVMSTRICL